MLAALFIPAETPKMKSDDTSPLLPVHIFFGVLLIDESEHAPRSQLKDALQEIRFGLLPAQIG